MIDENYLTSKRELAVILLIKEQLNILRAELNLPAITNEQVRVAYKAKLNSLGAVCDDNSPGE